MPRKRLIRTADYPYHVTIRSNNKEWFDLDMQLVWKICLNSLSVANSKYPASIHAFVLMNNHYHLMISTPQSNIDKFMFELNRNISWQMRAKSGRVNRIFGDRYKWSLVTSDRYLKNVVRYTYQNPLRGQLVERCEDYKFSTLYHQQNDLRLPFEIIHAFNYGEEASFLAWVNMNISEDEQSALKKGLSKPEFKLPKDVSRRVLSH